MDAAADPPTPEAARRVVKLVVVLRPTEAGHAATLAVGAEGCDPVFRDVEAPDLAAALAELPALVAEAEERWRASPRYPAARTTAPRPPPARRPATPVPADPVPAVATPAVGDQPTSPPEQAGQPAPAGQLALFG